MTQLGLAVVDVVDLLVRRSAPAELVGEEDRGATSTVGPVLSTFTQPRGHAGRPPGRAPLDTDARLRIPAARRIAGRRRRATS